MSAQLSSSMIYRVRRWFSLVSYSASFSSLRWYSGLSVGSCRRWSILKSMNKRSSSSEIRMLDYSPNRATLNLQRKITERRTRRRHTTASKMRSTSAAAWKLRITKSNTLINMALPRPDRELAAQQRNECRFIQ